MKKLALAIMAVTLMGCATEVDGVAEANIEHFQTNVNGVIVDCVLYDGYNAGGLTCNWGAYNDLRNGAS